MTNSKIILSLEDRRKILASVSKLVATKFYDPAYGGRNWKELVQSRTDAILAGDEPDEFARQMEALLSQLGTSHTAFFHRSARRIPAARVLSATLRRG